MGIWIKSQSGGLGKYIKIKPPIVEYKEEPDPENPFPLLTDEVIAINVVGIDMAGSIELLGTYPTEAQAKRVLDEIEVYISESEFLRRNRTGGYQDTVYHMPPAEQEG